MGGRRTKGYAAWARHDEGSVFCSDQIASPPGPSASHTRSALLEPAFKDPSKAKFLVEEAIAAYMGFGVSERGPCSEGERRQMSGGRGRERA